MSNSVTLRELALSDTENIVRWRNNIKVKENLYTQEDITVETHTKYFEKYVKTGKCKQYIIVTNDGCDIGTIFLKDIDDVCKKAEMGIFIGEDNARGKGYALASIKEILRIGFEEMNLHRIYLSVMGDNIPAILCYSKVGFKIEGILRKDYLKKDKYIDIVLMGFNAEEWMPY